MVSILQALMCEKGFSPDISTLPDASYHGYLLGAKRATCSKYVTPQTQIPTLISSWKANRYLKYVMSKTELFISTPLILKACSSHLNKCYPPPPSTQQLRQITSRKSLNSPFPQPLNLIHQYILSILLQKSISSSSTFFHLHHDHHNSQQSHLYLNKPRVF